MKYQLANTLKRSAVLVTVAALTACSGMSARDRDTAVGAAIGGAAVGGVIGNQVGKNK